MTIEQSHGKARPTLPRSSDLAVVETAGTPTVGRDSSGRFSSGNRIANGARWKASIRKLLGRGATSDQAESVARSAWRLYCAVLKELPSDGPSVRTLAALQARHAALAAHFTDRAAELGLDTEQGAAALEQATKHGQRAERLTVTAIDVATKLATAKPATTPPWIRPIDEAERAARMREYDPDEPALAVEALAVEAPVVEAPVVEVTAEAPVVEATIPTEAT